MASAAELWSAGWTALRENRSAEAERLGREAVEVDASGAEGWFLLGTARHFQGRPAEAVDCYTRALALRPDVPEVLINLGTALQDQGRPSEAEGHHRRALALRPEYPEAHNNLGNTLRELDRRAEAEGCFRQALRLRPDYPEAHNNLGNVLRELGRPGEAEVCFRRALTLRPDNPDIHHNLGNVLRDQRRLDEAEGCFRQALRIRPDYPEALMSLGFVLGALERPGEDECYRRALALRPNLPETLINLGNALQKQGQSAQAAGCFRQVLRLRPDLPEAHYNLGNALQDQRRPDQAIESFRRALTSRPDYPEALVNLGNALRHLGRPGEAVEHLRRALALRPDTPEALVNLGNVLQDVGQPSESEECYRRVLALRPDYPEAHNNLGNVLRGQGRVEDAEACFRRALELRPSYIDAHDALLQTLHYRPEVTPTELTAAHADYQRRYAAPLRGTWRRHGNDRDPERPLRIGLVSPDFGRHPVGFLLVRAVEALGRRPAAVLCYSDRRAPADDLTARFRSSAAVWRDTAELGDEQLAEKVRSDSVDVLIDLTGHTGGNRLLAFARRPAPVQATWLGYEGGTGLEAMDYLLADDCVVPSGAETHYSERILRLPGGYACYDPLADAPGPTPLPALTRGHVTFGCFNNPAKLSRPALAAFAAVFNRVPGSHLLLKYRGLDDPATAGRLRERLAAAGVGPERVELRGGSAHLEYLAAFGDVDIALDPFPFGGGVTTCDALWMGVPVVTLPQQTFASRHGLSYLTSAGLAGQLVARDVEDYVARAEALAQDLGRLADLRAGLRERVARSALCDGERLADELLQVLRGAWRQWAGGGVQ